MLWTLSARLFLLIAVVTLACLGLLAWVIVEMHTAHLEEKVVQGALGLSDTLRRSTRYSMLKNRKEDVYEIINTVGAQPGLERIRFFNKEGRIMFSTDPGEQDRIVDKQAEACTRCSMTTRSRLTPTEQPKSMPKLMPATWCSFACRRRLEPAGHATHPSSKKSSAGLPRR